MLKSVQLSPTHSPQRDRPLLVSALHYPCIIPVTAMFQNCLTSLIPYFFSQVPPTFYRSHFHDISKRYRIDQFTVETRFYLLSMRMTSNTSRIVQSSAFSESTTFMPTWSAVAFATSIYNIPTSALPIPVQTETILVVALGLPSGGQTTLRDIVIGWNDIYYYWRKVTS